MVFARVFRFAGIRGTINMITNLLLLLLLLLLVMSTKWPCGSILLLLMRVYLCLCLYFKKKIFAISMYSVHVRYYGLLAGILFGMLFNLCAVAHIFRERVLVSREALARLETKEDSADSVVAIDSTDDHLMIIDGSAPLSDSGDENERSINVNMRYRMSSPNAIQQLQQDAEILHSSVITAEDGYSRGKRKTMISRVTLSYVERVSMGIKKHTCLFLLTLLATILFTYVHNTERQ